MRSCASCSTERWKWRGGPDWLHPLSRIDEHTLAIKTGGVSYIPIPDGSTVNYAVLLSVQMPPNLTRGQVFNVAVRQITNASANVILEAAESKQSPNWRRVLGAFQLTIPVAIVVHPPT